MVARVSGLASLQKKLAAIPRATREEVRAVLEKSGDEMVSLAKSLAPVRTGLLKSTIKRRPGKNELAVEVVAGGAATTKAARAGNGVFDYAAGTEWGTSDTPSQPFFWPSYRAIKKRAKGRTTRAVRMAVKRAIGGG